MKKSYDLINISNIYSVNNVIRWMRGQTVCIPPTTLVCMVQLYIKVYHDTFSIHSGEAEYTGLIYIVVIYIYIKIAEYGAQGLTWNIIAFL